MLLCIDSGNTETVFSIWDGDAFVAHWRVSTSHERTADEYAAWLSMMRQANALHADAITAAVVSVTAPPVLFHLKQLCRDNLNCDPVIVGSKDCGLPTQPRVDPGVRVGPDRLANVAGAFDRHGGDSMVVDFGTATNFDVVDHDGAYIGGVIAPGVQISLRALHSRAAYLPHIDIGRPETVIGTNTVSCIQSGVFWGYVGMIEGVVHRANQEFGRRLKIIATGGLATLFAESCEAFDAVEEDLTVHGLRVLYEFNRSKR